MNTKKLPGTLWTSHGSWHWRVTFPGQKRQDITLSMPFTGERIAAGASRSLAESAAWRLWEQHSKTSADASTFTVNGLIDRWAKHAQDYYRDSRESRDSVAGLRLFRQIYGDKPVESLTHLDMLAYRDRLIDANYVRTTVNKYIGYVKRLAAWALDSRLMSAQTKAELTAIAAIKPHRSAARESEPITAVTDADIEATCAKLQPSIADMIRVHRLTGMRPGEMCQLNWQMIEKRGRVWIFRPRHKNEWRNIPRVVVIGPRAQRILEKYEGDGFVFTPQLALMDTYKKVQAGAKCHRAELKGLPRRVGDSWKVEAYAKAVKRGCGLAGVRHWHPNQLRHSCATEVRRRFGMAAAGAVLGHSSGLRITDRYSFEAAEDEMIKAASPAMIALG